MIFYLYIYELSMIRENFSVRTCVVGSLFFYFFCSLQLSLSLSLSLSVSSSSLYCFDIISLHVSYGIYKISYYAFPSYLQFHPVSSPSLYCFDIISLHVSYGIYKINYYAFPFYLQFHPHSLD